jgi:Tol biopolymer transport system component
MRVAYRVATVLIATWAVAALAPSLAGGLGAGGPKATIGSSALSISADGHHVAFETSASNLSVENLQGFNNIFVRDLDTGATMLASRAPGVAGATGNLHSYDPVLSANGRYIAFSSQASNFSPDDSDMGYDVYVRDLQINSTTLVSRANGATGAKANVGFQSQGLAISADGRYVAFDSWADNLSPDDSDTGPDVYVRDLQANTTTLVSRAAGAVGAKADGGGTEPSISADGRYVAFSTNSTNLNPADTDDNQDVYVRDLQAHTTTLVSRASGTLGPKGDSYSHLSAISADGSRVGFSTHAGNLGAGGNDDFEDVYVRDLQTNTTMLASRASGTGGAKGNDYSVFPSLSADGRYVSFSSGATNLHPADTDPLGDVFVRDLQANTTVLVSRATGAGGAKGDSDSYDASLSADGRYVGFLSTSLNLSPDDPDNFPDVYVRDLQDSVTSLESRATPGYPRPRGATPMRASLVPAYPPCMAPDRTHGAPLSFPSCANPQPVSASVTAGTPDANGVAANFIGLVQLTTLPFCPRFCFDADVKIAASLSDVRCKAGVATCGAPNAGAGPDYTGELQIRLPMRLTDKRSDIDEAQPATVQDFTFPATVGCTATPSTGAGSNCNLTTQANALVPGAVRDGRRSIWEVNGVRVYDGGPDGDVDTTAGNTVFATQGVFVP